jgi:hypothetical protein
MGRGHNPNGQKRTAVVPERSKLKRAKVNIAAPAKNITTPKAVQPPATKVATPYVIAFSVFNFLPGSYNARASSGFRWQTPSL